MAGELFRFGTHIVRTLPLKRHSITGQLRANLAAS
jgi:hypothetical protein